MLSNFNKSMIHVFTFDECSALNYQFSDADYIHINSEYQYLELRKKDGVYLVNEWQWVKTDIYEPLSLIGFKLFEIQGHSPENTEVKVRLNNGVSGYYWTGTEWQVAGTDDWNTMIEINQGITEWTYGKVAIVVGLKTSDAEVTPYVRMCKLLVEVRYIAFNEFLFGAIQSKLEAIRFLSKYTLQLKTKTNIFTLDEYQPDEKLNFIDVYQVFNHTDDPQHLNNLLSTYDPPTKTVTLSEEVAANKILWLLLCLKPDTFVNISTDYYDVGRTPCITVEDLDIETSLPVATSDSVMDDENDEATVVPSPQRETWVLSFFLSAGFKEDLGAMRDRLLEDLIKNSYLTIDAIHEKFRIMIDEAGKDITLTSGAGGADLYNASIRIRIIDVLVPIWDTYKVPVAKKFVYSFGG